MLAALALFVPALILVYVRSKLVESREFYQENIYTYLFAILGINWLIMMVLHYGFRSKGVMLMRLNSDTLFACKYIALAVVIAIAEPYCERFIRENISCEFIIPKEWRYFRWHKAGVALYALALFVMNFVRIFDNNFWGDEAYTTNLVKQNVSEIIATTAADVHPPLYYLIVKLIYNLFGDQGWAWHFASLIPCAIIILFALTAIWKKFGGATAIVLITLACLSGNAVHFNVEVRMYSWAALFMLLSFYYFYGILETKRIRDYALFVLFSLAAAYTHYYCVVAVSFFYISLVVYALFKKGSLKKAIGACIIAMFGYMPWFLIMIKAMLNRVSSYWITWIPTFRESMKYMFSNQFPSWLCWLLILLLVAVITYESGILQISRKQDGKYSVVVNASAAHSSNILLLIISGLLSVVGTVGFGILISHLVRPFYVTRYVYPVSIIAWLLLGILISRVKGSKFYALGLVLLMLSIFLPAYQKTYKYEKDANARLQTTLKTTGEINRDDIILTNHSHISWTIAKYYYGGTTSQFIDLSNPLQLKHGIRYWLIIFEDPKLEKFFKQVKAQGFRYEKVVNRGNLGTNNVDIYKIE